MAKTQAGIVGLPNVGKSTLFNALTRSRKAEAANYPFCTIEPNVGVVLVPDDRMQKLQVIAGTCGANVWCICIRRSTGRTGNINTANQWSSICTQVVRSNRTA